LDLAKIQSGEIGRRDFLSKGIGDEKRQQNIVFNYRSDDAEGRGGWESGWTGSLYALRDKRERYTNFDLSAPVRSELPLGGEEDKLRQVGLETRKITSLMLGSVPSQIAVGVQYNREQINALNFTATPERNLLAPSAGQPDTVGIDRTVLTTTQSLYAQWQIQLIAALKVTAGLRYDRLNFNVALRPEDDTFASAQTAGIGTRITSSASQVSPKLGAGLQVFNSAQWTTDLYANVARGLKSPYAFSDFYANVSGNSSQVPDLAISSLRSAEFGAQGGSKDGAVSWRAGVWDTKQDKEADRNPAGFLESFVKTSRKGFDVEGSFLANATTRIYGNYSGVRARSRTAPAGSDYITNVPEWTAAIGVSTVLTQGAHRFDLSLEDGVTGPQSLTSNNVGRGSTYQRISSRVAYSNREMKGMSAFVSLVAFDKQFEEPKFDFGGGRFGVAPRPKLQATIGAQIAF
jgi:TonB dependent receptor